MATTWIDANTGEEGSLTMEEMTTTGDIIRKLKRARLVWHEISRIKEEIEKLSSLRERVTPSYSQAPGGASGDKLADVTARIIELEKSQSDKIDLYLTEYKATEELIGLLGPEDMCLANILKYRYLNGERWEDIACLCHYSWRQVHYLHKKAVKEILKRLH